MLVSEVAAPVGAITDGIWLVGDEVPPGTYTSPGSDSCYWARLNGFGGTADNIITNYLGSTSPIVTIAASDTGFERAAVGYGSNSADGVDLCRIKKDLGLQ